MFFDKFVIESKKQCFGFTSERQIWLFCTAIIATMNYPRIWNFFAMRGLRSFWFLATKNIQL